MILTEARNIVDAAAFVAGLQAASRGVVRVMLGSPDQGQSVATGWLVTDSLVVVPDFALVPGWAASAETVHVVPAGGDPVPASIERGAVAPGATTPDPLQPALLRLSRPLAKRSLVLATSAPRVAEPVFLLHHPQGSREVMLSLGRLLGIDGSWIRYDADTEGGSAGAPVLSAEWRVLGMHSKSSEPGVTDGRFNEGASTPTLLERLSRLDAWPEIAAHHGLADVTGARQEIANVTSAPDPAVAPPAADDRLLAAAVSWTIDPATLGRDLRDQVAALVIDPRQPRWMLRGNERARLIAGASIEALRGARDDDERPELGQRVIDRILAGPPFDLDEIEEAELPFWLQAVRWFAAVVPDLPTPGDIHRNLSRRRGRSRLVEVAGPKFRGRKGELAKLGEWLKDPAGAVVAITGIGGVGKSALVAKYALGLPDDAILLWLDFDRADLAPDDAVSVLAILFEQLSLVIDDLALPALGPETWHAALDALSSQVAPALAGRLVLLVLDGFEIAQSAPEHGEIWDLLRDVLDRLPRAGVIVSGRAPIGDIQLAGRTVMNLHLAGLGRADAEAWLRDEGVNDREVLDAVVARSRGVPLILRLAVGLLASGGDVEDLAENLPGEMVEGFLYQRILDRVVDVDLKPLARDVLVLRQVTAAMLKPIVGDSLPKGVDPDAVFDRLAQEMALVGNGSEAGPALPVTISAGSDRLVLRPEVRAATVHLLEASDAKRVRTIDRRAARWYAEQPLDDPATRAELVYHRLRSGDIKGAAEVWTADCVPFLVAAVDDLPLRAYRARAWLTGKLAEGSGDPVAIQHAWEADALARLRAILARGLERGVAEVLAERSSRSPAGPLLVYDAWVAWRAGDLGRARALLADAPHGDGAIGRDRAVLAARLAVADGDADAADALLGAVDSDDPWKDRPQAVLDATTVTAARVRLAIDLDTERALLGLLRERGRPLPLPLPTPDVVLPLLTRRLGETGGYESMGERIPIPLSADELEAFAGRIDERRWAAAQGRPFLSLREPPDGDAARALMATDSPDSADAEMWDLAKRLEIRAHRRWALVAHGPFLGRAYLALTSAGRARDPQPLAIGGVLAAFVGSEWHPFRLYHPDAGPLDKVVRYSPLERLAEVEPPPTVDQLERAASFLENATLDWSMPRPPDLRTVLTDGPSGASTAVSAPVATTARSNATTQALEAFAGAGPALDGIGAFLLSPDPLDVLVRRVLGIPDQLGA